MSVKSDPATGYKTVTPSDTVPLQAPSRLYVGTLGTVTVKATANSPAVPFVGLQGWTPIYALYVMATGTTATDIVALY